jgi:hypothetical protein
MKRLIVVAATMAALLSLGAGQALAGNHSGPEALAKGSGALSATTPPVNTPIIGTVCINIPFPFCFPAQVGNTAVVTSTQESFDFSAKAGPQTLTPIDPTNGPFGTMQITLTSTTTTTVTADPICGSGSATGCPTPSTTTSPPQSATATAEVTCLNVVNNTAAIGGHVTKFSGNFPPTRGLLFNAVDNTVARQQVGPDLFDGTFVADAPQVCPAPSGGHPITSGDVYVQQS